MWVLGIESSCDETAAAVLAPDGTLKASRIHTQEAVHARFGGVVPELASREHLARIRELVEAALLDAQLTPDRLGGVAVTNGPGLVGSLLVGVAFAKALALTHALPLVGVNHLEGHLMAPFVEGDPPEWPLVALLVSGGHTSLVYAECPGVYRTIGATRDDAAGEAFDKVAKLMGLGYPGGARIDALAALGNPAAFAFPRGLKERKSLDFSFSGLKTALLLHLQARGAIVLDGQGAPAEAPSTLMLDTAASFQQAIVDVLVRKTLAAARLFKVRHVVVSGGVAANSGLRSACEAAFGAEGIRLSIPPRRHCTDNAAMIALAGRRTLLEGRHEGWGLQVLPRLGF